MQIINDYKKTPADALKSVAALGNFDGVHKGHIEVIKTSVMLAKKQGVPSAIITFEPHPVKLFKPGIKNYRLTSPQQKAQLLEGLGVDYLYVINFSRDFSKITATNFISEILIKDLDVSHIVTGYDYIFGHNKGGNIKMLEDFSTKLGYGYTQVKAVGNDEIFSSTKIRKALKDADLEKAESILGRNYEITGKIVKGDSRGKSIGFPTINVECGEMLRPKLGVYAVKIAIEGDTKVYNGVANIGTKPTFGNIEESLEVHIFNFANDVYGKNADIEFHKYIRAEKKFPNADELVKQIEKDCISARNALD